MGVESVKELPECSKGGKAANIGKVSKQYCMFLVGFCLIFAPHQAMIILQSSINIQQDTGTLAVGTAYAVSVLVALFITPIAIRRIGAKWVFVLGEVAYLLYISANFYPTKWLMIAAGTVLGGAEGMIWTVIPIYLWFFGFRHSSFGKKESAVYVRKYTAIFFASCQFAQVFGSSISYGILYGIMGENTRPNKTLSKTNNASETSTANEFEHCGSGDCNDPNVTHQNLNRYVPANSTSLFILIAVFCLMCFCGILIPIRFLPQPVPQNHLGSQIEDKLIQTKQEKKEISFRSTLNATVKHMRSMKQQLLIPISIYEGLVGSFIYSQASRSFGSCLFGVEKLGMIVIPYSIVNGLVSAMASKIMGRLGRRKLMVLLMVLDLSNYTFCLLWRPTEDNKYLVYAIFMCFAATYSLWTNCIIDGYSAYFSQIQEISYTVWNALLTTGLAIGFLWTPLLCVSIKIYIHIGLVCFSTICFAIADYSESGKLTRNKGGQDVEGDANRVFGSPRGSVSLQH